MLFCDTRYCGSVLPAADNEVKSSSSLWGSWLRVAGRWQRATANVQESCHCCVAPSDDHASERIEEMLIHPNSASSDHVVLEHQAMPALSIDSIWGDFQRGDEASPTARSCITPIFKELTKSTYAETDGSPGSVRTDYTEISYRARYSTESMDTCSDSEADTELAQETQCTEHWEGRCGPSNRRPIITELRLPKKPSMPNLSDEDEQPFLPQASVKDEFLDDLELAQRCLRMNAKTLALLEIERIQALLAENAVVLAGLKECLASQSDAAVAPQSEACAFAESDSEICEEIYE